MSSNCSGAIFTLSGARLRSSIGNFLLYAQPYGGSIKRQLARFWAQWMIPLSLIWKQRSPIDAIVAYDAYASGLAGWLLSIVAGSKLIVEVNGDDEMVGSSLLKAAIFRFVIRRADAVKVINRRLESYIRTHFSGKPVYLFPDYTCADYFAGLETYNGGFLFSVGHPADIKGMDLLVQAFNRISQKHPTVTLRIMGHFETDEKARLIQLAQGQTNITILPAGWIEDVGEQMRGCYAFVSASRREAQGRALFEAMACKKPVVATRTNGALDYVQDGQTGLLCNVGDIEDLAGKLDAVLSDPDKALQMGRKGFEWLSKYSSEESYQNSFLRMLEQVIERPAERLAHSQVLR